MGLNFQKITSGLTFGPNATINNAPPTGYSNTGISINNAFTSLAVTNPTADGAHGAPRTGSETAPANLALYHIIKT